VACVTTWSAAAAATGLHQAPREAVNTDKVAEVLPRIVTATNGMTLSALTALLSRLRRVQYEHRDEYDKTAVSQAMLDCFESFNA